MLKAMRKHARYFYVLFFIVIATFIFWGVDPVDKSTNTPVAKVDKHTITLEEYWKAYDNAVEVYRDVYKEKFDQKMLEKLNLKEKVLDSLIEEKVLMIAANKTGITVTDEELEESIKNDPVFQKDGSFSHDLYQRLLKNNRLNDKTFEAMKRKELTLRKMKKLIEDSVELSPTEMKGLGGEGKFVKLIEDAVLKDKKEKAFKSYMEGLKKQMGNRIEKNTKLIS